VDASLDFDTRNNAEDPRTGWLISADLEHGWSDEVTLGPTDPLVRAPALAPVRVRYTRLFADARRYNRMGPQGQLNLRLVLGARLGGDPLPLERRFSLGGAGSLPGYDFRQRTGGADVLSCNGSAVAPGTPALCERMVLGMAEYRHDFLLRLFRHGEDSRYLIDRRAAWVLFTDAGRGWLVGARSADERYPSGELPSLRTFKTDAGLGLDLHWLGIYVAKSLSDWDLEPNLVVRLRHRF
jgi:outer membrane protein assembly factor BamA